MISRPIFRDHKLPIARTKGRLPLFLDFSSGRFPEESLYSQFINETVSKTANIIDGIILSPQHMLDLSPINSKEVWVRVDSNPSSFLANLRVNESAFSSFLNARYLSQNAVSGIVCNLVLGCSASDEADNIQGLAFLRTLSNEVGIPLAVDFHVVEQLDDENKFLEIVELGLTLAVELGGDIMIIPGGGYLSLNNHFDQITDLPLFIKQPISPVLRKNYPSEILKNFQRKLDGVIFTDLRQLEHPYIDPEKLNMWANSFCSNKLESGS